MTNQSIFWLLGCLLVYLGLGWILSKKFNQMQFSFFKNLDQECKETIDFFYPGTVLKDFKAPPFNTSQILTYIMLGVGAAGLSLLSKNNFSVIESIFLILGMLVIQTSIQFDAKYQFLPDEATYFFGVCGLLFSLGSTTKPPIFWVNSAVTLVVVYALFTGIPALFKMLGREGTLLGGGDLKLIAACIPWLSQEHLIEMIALSSVLFIGWWLVKVRDRVKPVAWGPFIGLGWFIMLLVEN